MQVLKVCHSNLISNEKLIIITFLGHLRHFSSFWHIISTRQTFKVFHFNEESCIVFGNKEQCSKSERTIKERKTESKIVYAWQVKKQSNYFVNTKYLNVLLKNMLARMNSTIIEYN